MTVIDASTTKMENSQSDQITFGWWNTGLSPVGIPDSDDDKKSLAAKIVGTLVDEFGVDCLALGEITYDDLRYLRGGCATPTLSAYDGSLKDGRLQFDTGVLYDRARLEVVADKSLITAHGKRKLKLANHICFLTTSDKSVLNVFVTHWPSRGFTEENIQARKSLAMRLREKVVELEQASSNAAIVLLGDFNDEPFDEAMASFLLATRDRRLASSAKYLYNPFWRHLGESNPYSRTQPSAGVGGTYYHRKGTETRWRTFDQILFSSAFLGNGNWHLDERQTIILQTDALVELIQTGTAVFDHLPVLSVIERNVKGE